MELKHFALQQSSVALTLLSMAECVTYIVASFLGDYLKDRLVYVNIVSSSCLAVICIIWPLVDITYVMILAVAIGTVSSSSSSPSSSSSSSSSYIVAYPNNINVSIKHNNSDITTALLCC